MAKPPLTDRFYERVGIRELTPEKSLGFILYLTGLNKKEKEKEKAKDL